MKLMPPFIASIFGLLMLFQLTQCAKIPNEGIPSYIQIDTIGITMDADSQGAAAIYAPIFWVEAGPENLGGWQIPAKIPILQSGVTKVRIFAGIYKNAISEYYKYPFFDFYEAEVDLKNTEITTLFPKVKYKPAVKFSFMEDFENSPTFNDLLKTPNTDNDYKGKFFGQMTLTSSSEKKTVSTKLISVPMGKEAFLEFDYKTDNPGSVFFVSAFYANQSDDTDVWLQLSSTNKWRRAYIPIAEDIGARGGLPFNLMYTLIKKDDQSQSSISIDNIKIVHF